MPIPSSSRSSEASEEDAKAADGAVGAGVGAGVGAARKAELEVDAVDLVNWIRRTNTDAET